MRAKGASWSGTSVLVETVPTTLKLMTNIGLLATNQQGHLNNYGNLWYHLKAIRNIPSLIYVQNKKRIIYDSENGYIVIVINTKPGVHNMIFTSNNDILHYNDTSNTKGVYMLDTMEENLKHYTQQSSVLISTH